MLPKRVRSAFGARSHARSGRITLSVKRVYRNPYPPGSRGFPNALPATRVSACQCGGRGRSAFGLGKRVKVGLD